MIHVVRRMEVGFVLVQCAAPKLVFAIVMLPQEAGTFGVESAAKVLLVLVTIRQVP
mgnify:CR=1 FL=1